MNASHRAHASTRSPRPARRGARLVMALACLALPAGLAACITDAGPKAENESRGVVLSYSRIQVWEQTKITFTSIGRILHLDEAGRSADVVVGPGRTVSAVIEPYDASDTKTIVRISAHEGTRETPAVASRVLARIQEELLASGIR